MDEPSSTTERLGVALKAARNAKHWSLDEAVFQARTQFPNLRVRRGKIHRIEEGVSTRDRLDMTTVMALAVLYDVSLEDLEPELVDEALAIKEVAAANFPWFDDHPPPPLHPVTMAA